MTRPEDLDAMQAAYTDVMTEAENLVEALIEAAEVSRKEETADRMRGWSQLVELIGQEARRVANSLPESKRNLARAMGETNENH
jgi:hypothetical protein